MSNLFEDVQEEENKTVLYPSPKNALETTRLDPLTSKKC